MNAQEIYEAQGVMLAESVKFDIAGVKALTAYSFELKWDGVRCLMWWDGTNLLMRSRTGKPMVHKYPDLEAIIRERFGATEVVLDGEVIAFDSDGRPTFNAIQQRDSQSDPRKIAARAATIPATFVAFDVLYANGTDLRDQPQWLRREALEEFFSAIEGHAQVIVSPVWQDPEPIMRLVIEQGLEGVMAKNNTSIYRGGRRKSWLKVKATKSLTAIVTGYEPGLGSRADTFGALNIALLDGNQLVSVGKVGTGFKQRDLNDLLPRLQAGEQLLIEVEYLEATKDGQLRFPSYKGVRLDVEVADCNLTQVGVFDVA